MSALAARATLVCMTDCCTLAVSACTCVCIHGASDRATSILESSSFVLANCLHSKHVLWLASSVDFAMQVGVSRISVPCRHACSLRVRVQPACLNPWCMLPTLTHTCAGGTAHQHGMTKPRSDPHTRSIGAEWQCEHHHLDWASRLAVASVRSGNIVSCCTHRHREILRQIQRLSAERDQSESGHASHLA